MVYHKNDYHRLSMIPFFMALALYFTPALSYAQNNNLKELIEDAKKEGELMIWDPMDQPVAQEMGRVFQKRFPGIKVKHFEIFGTEATQRIIVEATAGRVSLDVLETSTKDILELMKRKLVVQFNDWVKLFGEIGLTEREVLLGGYGTLHHHLSTPVMINTHLVSKKDVPRTWKDLLDPKWKGRILFEQRALPFGWGAPGWESLEKLREFGQKLKGQQLIFLRGGTTVMKALIAGEGAIGLGGYGYKVKRLRDKGAPIDIAPVSPVGASTRPTVVIKGAEHPNTARLWNGWIATPEGQKALAVNGGYGRLGRGSQTWHGKRYDELGVQVVFETPDNIDIVNKGIRVMRDALGIR